MKQAKEEIMSDTKQPTPNTNVAGSKKKTYIKPELKPYQPKKQ